MTTFTGHTKGSTASESQIALNNFKSVQKGMHQDFLYSRMIFTMISTKDLSWQPSRHKDSMTLQIQILILMMVINMTSNSSWKNNLLCILFRLLLFRQTKEENWSRSLKGMQGPSFPSSTITTLSQMLHNMRL